MIKYKKKKGETKMTTEEFLELLNQIKRMKCESQILELKSADFLNMFPKFKKGTQKHILYLSSFQRKMR